MTFTTLLKTAYLLVSLVLPDWAPLLQLAAEPVEVRPATYQAEGRTVQARLYRPGGAGPKAGLVLTHGMAWAGMEDARIVALAQRLAECGFVVLTPDLEELRNFELQIRSAERISAAALYLRELPEVDPARVGLFGVSYAGSLGVIAAAQPELAGRLRFLVSFGGYWDFEDLVRYTLAGAYPSGPQEAALEPELYGRLAIYYNFPELLEAGIETDALREICYWGLHHDYRRADALRDSLSQSGRAILRSFWGMSGENPCVGLDRFRRWRAGREQYLQQMALATWVQRVELPEAFLLHSAQDSLVPAAESRRLAAALRRRGSLVHLEVTPLFHHIDAIRDGDPRAAFGWQRLGELISLYRFFLPLVTISQPG